MQRARIAAALGDREAAFEHFERGATLGVVRVALGHDLHSDPLYEPLRGDPRFERVNRGESREPAARSAMNGKRNSARPRVVGALPVDSLAWNAP
jgi:hypothetical protein